MNVRVDAQHLRVRLSLEEAQILDQGGYLAQPMALPPHRLTLELRVTGRSDAPAATERVVTVEATGACCVRIPEAALKTMLDMAQSGEARPHPEPVWESVWICGGYPAGLSVEIDLFSLRPRKKHRST